MVLQWGKISDRFTPWSDAENVIGNGAFAMKAWKFNDHIEVVKNPHYWDAANVKLNGIKFFPIENSYSESRAFLAGQLHSTYKIPPDLVGDIKKNYPQFLRQEPYVGNNFIRFNVTRPGLNNQKVRQALSYAINRKEICDTILEGFKPAGTVTPEMGDYKPEQIAVYDLAKAKALLAEAGFPDGKDLPKFSLLISSGGGQAGPEAIQSMWKEIGVKVDIRKMDFASYNSAQQRLDYAISIAGW
ncbi:MAG: peptide ABC transporter substrate-binding protein, partial [Verrucomicrobiales bacterium VVV1]